MSKNKLTPAYLRQQIVGVDSTFETPFGERLMVYCDYTASGRCLRFVESYLQSLQRVYANTHTEDDITGRSMSQLLHEAEEAIKASVNAGPDGRIIACGTGATGAIDKLQQLVGVALAPATRQNFDELLDRDESGTSSSAFRELLAKAQPVVFVGPYEHHSNEISWRHSLATTVQVRLDASGNIDFAHLEQVLKDPRYQGRLRIGSFSAASNVTGIRTDVHKVASLLHAHDARQRRGSESRCDIRVSAQISWWAWLEWSAGVQRAHLPSRAAAQRQCRWHGRLCRHERRGLHQSHRRAGEGRDPRCPADAEGRTCISDQGPGWCRRD
jgi:selenocysteine lyase/cysteine desulfurase